MRAYDRQETFDMLPFRALARSIDAMLQAKKTGKAVAPARMTVQMEDKGTLLIMPASQGSLAVVKLVTVHPDNYAVRRMPTIQGEVVVIDTDDGSRLGVLDGMALTARRTAALTMLAARKV
ncbi:delta(1)-pyrroline-2-carboxylate reductase family protein, partial [Desulfocurvibacter africanus]